MKMGPQTLRHLEIFQNYKGELNGSFYQAINRTKTSAGARMLRSWLSFPLYDIDKIRARQARVAVWQTDLALLKSIRQLMGNIGDLERRFAKVAGPQSNGRDLHALADSLESALEAENLICQKTSLDPFSGNQTLQNFIGRIRATIIEDPPLSTKQGFFIQKGVHSGLDELIDLSTHANDLIAQMESREREATGITSLKIRYNNVFGYYIEVTHTHRDKIPTHYQRKQTLTNAERYCTDELVELERKILSAHTRRADLESEVFETLKKDILSQAQIILQLAHRSAENDVVLAFAWLGVESRFVIPEILGGNEDDGQLELIGSRHPVVEQSVGLDFVANDIRVGAGGCLLLTGPNMAGKSTLMRQVALTVILAQCGAPVPAQKARLPLFDALFTRIGASDQLSEGLSTFMVEMTETSHMLIEATSNSLLILDEVGRGTSTFDGMCLAQAILEHIMSELKATTLFATHYHELTELSDAYSQIINGHMSIVDTQDGIRFTHTLLRGPAKKSYGVHVAELAGIPGSVTRRARSLLKGIEKTQQGQSSQLSLIDYDRETPPEENPRTLDSQKQQVFEKLMDLGRTLRNYQLYEKTPIETMNRVVEWKSLLDGMEI
jgi:DNA mismatch repair protein MutS